jgi:hypothetical protein
MTKLPWTPPSTTNDMDCSGESRNVDFRCAASRGSRRSRKAVSFSRAVTAYKVIHINDYTEEEIAATWNGRSELMAIKMNILETLSRMKEDSRNTYDSDGYCPRGLEHLTDEGAVNRRRRRETAIDAVLEEQELQYEDNMHDELLIADIYSRHTHFSRTFARVVGLADENASKEIYQDDFCLKDSSRGYQHSSLPKHAIPSSNAAVLPASGVVKRRIKEFSSRAA